MKAAITELAGRELVELLPTDLSNWESLKIMGPPSGVNMEEDRIVLGRRNKEQKLSLAEATKKWRFPAAVGVGSRHGPPIVVAMKWPVSVQAGPSTSPLHPVPTHGC